ncbi:iron ABC transporter permease [bacterium]|nr:iron ABC transporter permease [bacterium]
MMPLQRKWMVVLGGLLFLFVGCIIALSFLGNPILSFSVLSEGGDATLKEIFFNIRIPRLLMASLVGAGLSVSGVSFQSLLKNPLADPYILGISGGAALGSVLGSFLGFSVIFIQITAFIFSLLSILFLYRLASVNGRIPVHTLLLSGVIFNAFSFALILLVMSFSAMGQAQQILAVLMGNLEVTNYQTVLLLALFVGGGFLILFTQSLKMNVMSLGEEVGTSLGINLEKHRLVVFVAASMIVGASVSAAGLIGFVGLFVPHIIRLLFGSDNRLVLPASFLGGAIFLMFCDFLAKTVLTVESIQTQLPVGVVTALMGGPFFMMLLLKDKKNA